MERRFHEWPSAVTDHRGQFLRVAVGFAGRSNLLTAQKAAAFRAAP